MFLSMLTVGELRRGVASSVIATTPAGEFEEDIRNHCREHVMALSGFGTYRGHAGRCQSFKLLWKAIAEGECFDCNRAVIEGEYGFLEWTANTEETFLRARQRRPVPRARRSDRDADHSLHGVAERKKTSDCYGAALLTSAGGTSWLM